jgi:flagellar biosynthesis/type III secretory pathway M-ring protein FliF/YscJ
MHTYLSAGFLVVAVLVARRLIRKAIVDRHASGQEETENLDQENEIHLFV